MDFSKNCKKRYKFSPTKEKNFIDHRSDIKTLLSFIHIKCYRYKICYNRILSLGYSFIFGFRLNTKIRVNQI